MWPFKSKKVVEERNKLFAATESEFPIGHRVRHLGLDMTVVSHHKYALECDIMPGVWLEYVDHRWRIQSTFIHAYQFALIRQEPPRGETWAGNN